MDKYYAKGLGIYQKPEGGTMGFLIGRVEDHVTNDEESGMTAAEAIADALNKAEERDGCLPMGTHTAMMDAVYKERNTLAAMLARLYPSGVKRTAIEGWDPEWENCVYIDTPMGQLSWHYHDRDADLFANLEPYAGEWDGHTTEEKYDRLARLMFRIDSMKLEHGTYTEVTRFEAGEPELVGAILGDSVASLKPLPQTYTDWLAGTDGQPVIAGIDYAREDDLGKLQASVPSPEDGKR
jgi:hypothetical protein